MASCVGVRGHVGITRCFAWCSVLCALCSVLGAWCLVLGAWCLVLGGYEVRAAEGVGVVARILTIVECAGWFMPCTLNVANNDTHSPCALPLVTRPARRSLHAARGTRRTPAPVWAVAESAQRTECVKCVIVDTSLARFVIYFYYYFAIIYLYVEGVALGGPMAVYKPLKWVVRLSLRNICPEPCQ